MKVAFYVYPVAFQSPGGGEIVLLKTKEYLEREGVEVKLLDVWRDKLADYDILHTFGSVKDSLRMMEAARMQGVKNVLSTICWYSWKSAWGTYPQWKQRVPSVIRHAAKCFFPFLPSQRRRMMQISDLLLPNSENEAQQLRRFFCVNEKKITVIPNGVDARFELAKPELFYEKYKLRDFVLIVGRIEPRKNQLNVVRALKDLDRPVVFVGDFVPDYKAYYDQCRREASSNMYFLGGMSHESELLSSAYAACDTFLLATWLETPGLAALEAGAAGAKVVITREGATREYFRDYALYTGPDKPGEILKQVKRSLAKPKDGQLTRHIQDNYLWPVVAKKTKEAYQKLLGA